MKKIILVFLLLINFLPFFVSAQEQQGVSQKFEIWYFYDKDCPYCKEGKSFLNRLQLKYPNLKVRQYEVSDNQANAAIFNVLIENYQMKETGVPTFLIGDAYVIGYNSKIAGAIEQVVINCQTANCGSPSKYIDSEVVGKRMSVDNFEFSWPWFIGFVFVIILLVALFLPKKDKDLTDLE